MISYFLKFHGLTERFWCTWYSWDLLCGFIWLGAQQEIECPRWFLILHGLKMASNPSVVQLDLLSRWQTTSKRECCKKISHSMQVLIKPLLATLLLMSHGPKQVTWLRSESIRRVNVGHKHSKAFSLGVPRLVSTIKIVLLFA